MPLVITYAGVKEFTNRWRERILGVYYTGGVPYYAGLFRNDWTPDRTSTIAEAQPATFSGYSGLQQLLGWQSPVLVGDRAVSYANQLTWTVAAGGIDNFIFGWYWVDSAGVLLAAERNPLGPIGLSIIGQTYTIKPSFGERSTWPLH